VNSTDASGISPVPLYAPIGAVRVFVIGRSGRDFSQRDRELACRVQPLLTRLDRHLTELQRLRDSVPLARTAICPEERAAELCITPRELTVLALLAEGLTATAIARRLGITPHTVTKHQENLYRKLATKDRLTTVLIAQSLGLVAARTPNRSETAVARSTG
jgi:DNA-binding NarL/FixJ family response regulator